MWMLDERVKVTHAEDYGLTAIPAKPERHAMCER
jgi:hypothetical protein